MAVEDRTRQLSVMLDDVKRSDEGRKRLIADVSHEWRTPLTIIKGEAEIALRGARKSPDAYEDALRRVREAATHTARLVDDLLFVARTEAGEVRLDLHQLDLSRVVGEALEIFGHEVPLNDCIDDGACRVTPVVSDSPCWYCSRTRDIMATIEF